MRFRLKACDSGLGLRLTACDSGLGLNIVDSTTLTETADDVGVSTFVCKHLYSVLTGMRKCGISNLKFVFLSECS